MWNEDSWQPYGEYEAPASSSWRQHHRVTASQSQQQGAPPNGPYGRQGYARHYQPYGRPVSHPAARPPQHSPTTASAMREMSWRNANDGWGGPMRMRNGVATIAPPWHDEMAAYHHHQAQIAHAHAMRAAALSKLSSVEITTPHAGGELRAKPIVCEEEKTSGEDDAYNIGGAGISKLEAIVCANFDDDDHGVAASHHRNGESLNGGVRRPLYNDFSEPDKPREVELRFDKSAIRITVSWTFPDLPSIYKYKQRIEVRDNLTIIEEEVLAAHIASYRFKTIPGCDYQVKLTIFDTKGVTVASASKKCRAVFSLDEIDKLMAKALAFIGTAMQPFTFLYRCKPKIYWDDIYLRRNGIMERYLKDNNGQAASPINGEISGMFFSAKTLADGSLPPSSPFGDIRMILPALSILDPARISAFFCDFYCNRLTHYVTVVICEKGSQSERFCREKLRPLDLKDNRFLRIAPTNNPNMPYAFFSNRSLWVEVYYTENIPMHWGRFDHIIATGAGTSKIGGLPHNKSCLTCNLYPVGPQPGVDMEPVEDLVASYENSQAQQRSADSEYLFPRNSTRYTALGCIQAELLAPSSAVSAEVSKEDYLEVAETIVYSVDRVVYEESLQNLERFDKNLKNGFDKTERGEEYTKGSNSRGVKRKHDGLEFEEENEPSQNSISLVEIVDIDDDDEETSDDLLNVGNNNNNEVEKNDSDAQIACEINNGFTAADLASNSVSSSAVSSDSTDNSIPDSSSSSLNNLTRVLDRVHEHLPADVPLVTNLVAKIRALAREMNTGFKQINSEIETKRCFSVKN